MKNHKEFLKDVEVESSLPVQTCRALGPESDEDIAVYSNDSQQQEGRKTNLGGANSQSETPSPTPVESGLDEEIITKKQELDSMIAKDNTAYWNRTGDNFDKDVTKLRNELNELEQKRDADQKGDEQ